MGCWKSDKRMPECDPGQCHKAHAGLAPCARPADGPGPESPAATPPHEPEPTDAAA